jgi:hypothetical protein
LDPKNPENNAADSKHDHINSRLQELRRHEVKRGEQALASDPGKKFVEKIERAVGCPRKPFHHSSNYRHLFRYSGPQLDVGEKRYRKYHWEVAHI